MCGKIVWEMVAIVNLPYTYIPDLQAAVFFFNFWNKTHALPNPLCPSCICRRTFSTTTQLTNHGFISQFIDQSYMTNHHQTPFITIPYTNSLMKIGKTVSLPSAAVNYIYSNKSIDNNHKSLQVFNNAICAKYNIA